MCGMKYELIEQFDVLLFEYPLEGGRFARLFGTKQTIKQYVCLAVADDFLVLAEKDSFWYANKSNFDTEVSNTTRFTHKRLRGNGVNLEEYTIQENVR